MTRVSLFAAATVVAVAFTSTAAGAATPPPTSDASVSAVPSTPEIIPNSHLIFLQPGANQGRFRGWVNQQAAQRRGRQGSRAGSPDVIPRIERQFNLGRSGQTVMTGTFDDALVAQAKARADVADVFPNKINRILNVQNSPPNNGLPRVSSQNTSLQAKYSYPDSAGEGVTVYVLDTGIRVTHTDFGGRASLGYTAVAGTADANDDHGHGTHVGGIVGGGAFGVAKKANLVAVKVCSSDGECTTEDIVEGISFVISHSQQRGQPGKSVVNMSLGGPVDEAVDQAVQIAIDSGIPFAVAAGNSNVDACTFSPARVPAAVTVGALTSTSNRASFSNFGPCTDVFAPGSSIRSLWNADDNATKVVSGTSMSSPFAAGVLALFAGEGEFTVQELSDAIVNMATTGLMRNLQAGTPNRIVYNGGESPALPGIPTSASSVAPTTPVGSATPSPVSSTVATSTAEAPATTAVTSSVQAPATTSSNADPTTIGSNADTPTSASSVAPTTAVNSATPSPASSEVATSTVEAPTTTAATSTVEAPATTTTAVNSATPSPASSEVTTSTVEALTTTAATSTVEAPATTTTALNSATPSPASSEVATSTVEAPTTTAATSTVEAPATTSSNADPITTGSNIDPTVSSTSADEVTTPTGSEVSAFSGSVSPTPTALEGFAQPIRRRASESPVEDGESERLAPAARRFLIRPVGLVQQRRR